MITQRTESGHTKRVMDREMLMQQRACAACGQTFALGESVVLACGAWEGPPQWIHESDAAYDRQTSTCVELRCVTTE